MLCFNIYKVYELLHNGYREIITSSPIEKIISSMQGGFRSSSLRSLREGDSLTLLYAAYMMKLKPYCEVRNLRNVKLISNAFGAMNSGLILKYLLDPSISVTHSNIFFAQHRLDDAVYQEEHIEQCCFISRNEPERFDNSETVFLVDDSVFSGKTFRSIQRFCPQVKHLHFLPLSFNSNCMKYCRFGVYRDFDTHNNVHEVIQISEEVGNVPPPFESFWDCDHSAAENKIITGNPEFRAILDGDNLLLKHLWAIYADKIFAV